MEVEDEIDENQVSEYILDEMIELEEEGSMSGSNKDEFYPPFFLGFF